MRVGRKLVAVVGFAAGLAGVVAAVAGGQLQMLLSSASATPRALTVTELAEAGTGGNAHVELTGFKFGKPVIEKGKEGEWMVVWLPVLPARDPAKPLFRNVYLRTTHIDDQKDLDKLLNQSTLRTLVASALPQSSLFAVKPSSDFYQAEPNLDPKKTVFLCDAQLDLNGAPVLVGEQLFNRSFLWAAWAVVGVAFALVFVGLAVGSVPAAKPAALPADRASLREALFQESPMSIHRAMYGPVVGYILLTFVVGVPLLGALGLGAAYMAMAETTRGYMDLEKIGYAAGLGVVSAFLFGILWAIVAATIITFRGVIAEVVMCNHGLRWRVGKVWNAALWSDVKSVTRGESIVMRNGVEVSRFGVCRVTLRDDRELVFDRSRISDYPSLADAIQATTSDVVAAEKQRQLAAGEVTFGPVTVKKGGLVVDGRDVPWDNLERFEVVNGHLIIYRRRSWFFKTLEVPLAQIPDYMALLDILQMRDDGYVTRGLTVTGGLVGPPGMRGRP